jgi:hypothetical protein
MEISKVEFLINNMKTNCYCLGVLGEEHGVRLDFPRACTIGAQGSPLCLFNYLRCFHNC